MHFTAAVILASSLSGFILHSARGAPSFRYNDRIQVAPATVGNSTNNDNYADPAPMTGDVENIVDSLISTLNSLLAPLEGGGGGGGGIL
ncbi:hypothetical protein C8J57DRAFT_1518296 [Mycena rebaudengoi]|nr:hypothetical protein C8J57DRAFT_1518296 [Mycena rebaudengoi]